jgi:hypothetical protein
VCVCVCVKIWKHYFLTIKYMNTPTIDSVTARLQEHAKGLPEGLQPDVAGMKAHYFQTLVVNRVGAALFVKELNYIADHVDAKI